MENRILYTENLSVGYGADPVLRELCLQAEAQAVRVAGLE